MAFRHPPPPPPLPSGETGPGGALPDGAAILPVSVDLALAGSLMSREGRLTRMVIDFWGISALNV